ncbi:LysR substrate-binding domain-containing protein [Pseudomonas qingdaonensis]|nr:LysR substrate-binding domain-containing protein [Pseudomonas qingdaonensis]
MVRTGSFTRAAAELSLTQSAVSKQIKLLEEHLGAPLFERRARGITLTAAGSGFNAIVEPMLDSLLANVLRLKSGHGSRNVSVICTHAVAQYWLFPRLLRFNAQHPELTVNIHASNEMDERVVGNYDFGVLYGHGRWSSLQADKLFDECIYPIVSTQRALPPADSLAALQALPLIQLDASAWNCLDWPDWFAHLGVRYKAPADAVTFNQITLVFDAVMQGMGVGLGWGVHGPRAHRQRAGAAGVGVRRAHRPGRLPGARQAARVLAGGPGVQGLVAGAQLNCACTSAPVRVRVWLAKQ